eukprot:maker-scaffold199_size265817-snap-gene-0.14 protein:Tk08925 transcript:maker-scaffold199_size265817-snap-gene-0.14-mRNA-1 annotation:"rna 3 -terminal phosphate cyclase-like protein"
MSSVTRKTSSLLEFEGGNFLRARMVMATLSGKSIRISRIRELDLNPGLREFEASFVRLIDKATNGSRIEVNQTGTRLAYHPGLLVGGKIEHDCHLDRGIGYYLEPFLQMAPFCKNPLHLILRGVTNNQVDPSPDLLRLSALPIMKRYFIIDEGLEIKVQKRGAAPDGGGQVVFKCPIRKSLKALQITDQGKIKRIRGTAWAARVSPAMSNRMVEAAKGILLKFIPDIYIYTDNYKGAQSGKSAGFGLTLTAETTTGAFLSAEVCSEAKGSENVSIPEDLGVEGAKLLLEEIYRGGCIDSTNQSLMFLFMTVSQRDVSKVVSGPLSNYSIQFLRHIKDFFELRFKLETHDSEEKEEELRFGCDKVMLTCQGTGYVNLSKRTT